MDQYEWVRTAHRVYKKSIRQIAREAGHMRRTVRKVLAGQDPKYRREKEPACPVMDPVAGIVEGWLRADREQPVKQRHTAHRVWRRLVDEHGFTGAEPTVRRWVRERKMRLGWHRPGGGLVQTAKGLEDNGIWRIEKPNRILFLPDVGSTTTSFSSAFAGIFASK